MSIYSKDGLAISQAYIISGEKSNIVYDIDGNIVLQIDPYIEGRTLTFEDNFSGDALDATKWTYELGYGRNNELQQFWEKCVAVEDGCCVITAKKLDSNNTPYESWESGSINTQDLFSQRYGRFEAKIKFPNIVGAFPAFWLVGTSLHHNWEEGERWTTTGHWPGCGEVDIVEMIPGNATTAQANLWDSSSTAQNPISLGSGRSETYNPAEWHIYAFEWTDEYMSMQLDGVEYKKYVWSSFSPSEISAYTGDEEMMIILNLSVGASGGTPASSTNEMKMYIDWVRVYAPLES